MCKELKPVTPGGLSGAEARRRVGLSSFTTHFVVLSFFVLFLAGCGTKTTDTTSPLTAPSAPTGLSAAAGNGQVMISWSSVSGATSYNIYWSTTTGVTKTSGTKITGATSPYTHTTLTNGTIYYYIVTAVNSSGESVESAQASATPAVPTVDVTGTWTVTVISNAGGGTFTMNLIQSGSSVSGTVTIMSYTGNLSGSVTGSNISLTVPDPQPTCSGSVGSLTGTVSGNTMSGSHTSTAGGTCPVESGTWSATKQTTVAGAKFPIATTTADEGSVSAAFDGTNYLVGIRDDTSAIIGAQLMDGSGNLIGSRISTGRTGGEPWIAFNGTNYLMAWDDGATTNHVIYGEVISKTGTVVKAPFAISTTAGNLSKVSSIVCLGGGCSVMWSDDTTKAVYGRTIDSTGSFASNEYTIESGTATGHPGGKPFAACDASGNCIAVYDTSTEIRASIKGPTITKNTFVIATKVQGCSDQNPSPVVFDGTNYLVVWNDHSDCAGTPAWDVLAQRVDVNGNMVGTAFQVNSASTKYAAIPFMAFDGTNFLVTWMDGRNDANHNGVCDAGEGTCWDVYGQYISKAGLLVGSEIVINNDAGNQFGMVTGFNNGKYLAIINTGITLSQDIYGVFITP